jgi:hypothetical protein
VNRAEAIAILAAPLLLVAGCSARSGPPLSYLALRRPEGPIATMHVALTEKHGRGGWYFGNHNFRPAPDIQAYLEQAHEHAGSDVLGDADIVLDVPFAIDILFFGYNHSTDKVTAKEPEDD